MVEIVPEGEKRVAVPGKLPDTVNAIPSLQGPYPTEFQVWIHHWAAPCAKTAGELTEQVPVPDAQPACSAVYHCRILGDALASLTHR